MTPAELHAKVARTRAAQRLHPTVQDPAALERAAAALRLVTNHREAVARDQWRGHG